MSVIDRIEGREDDIFLFKDKTGKIIKVFSDIMGRCLLYVEDVKEYRIVQTDHDKLDIYIDNTSVTVQKAITDEIERLAQKLLFSPPKLSYKQYSYELGKKLKRIERQYNK
jgi:phenylacetate-coenzyme A ligase PaaK-like adenylate-forming protein